MARSNLTDYLQNYPFWLMDIAPIEPLALPLFTPLLGFSAITAPEINVDITEITEANWFFRRKVVKGADVSNVTLSRAAKWYDNDFYKWVLAALAGNTGGRGALHALAVGGATPRRDLLLVHFLSRNPLPAGMAQGAAATAGVLALQGTSTAMTAVHSGATGVSAFGLSGAAVGNAFAIGTSIGFAAGGKPLGPFEFAPRLPAKAWVLYGCVPARYKAAGDFDATDGGISIQELELAVESWDELSLGTEAATVAYGLAIADAVRTPASR
jgi:hypothetical protein